MKKPLQIGGQALIEGVMIKAPKKVTAAVRTTQGKIVTTSKRFVSKAARYPWKLPFLRGVINLLEMLVLGMQMLTWSANQQSEEEEELTKGALAVAITFSFAVAIALFVLLPYYVSKLFFPPATVSFNLIDGFFRLCIFILYIAGIGLMPDIRRMYQYHGAEHMSIHCYESSKELTSRNIRKYSTLHPRCGTSFLLYVIMVSIIIFSFIKSPIWYYNVSLRILLIPVVAGISFELLKLCARFNQNKILGLLTLPGLLAQKITTQRPTTKQIEVAVAAVKKAL